MNDMFCKRCGVGKISKYHGVGHGSVPCRPLFQNEYEISLLCCCSISCLQTATATVQESWTHPVHCCRQGEAGNEERVWETPVFQGQCATQTDWQEATWKIWTWEVKWCNPKHPSLGFWNCHPHCSASVLKVTKSPTHPSSCYHVLHHPLEHFIIGQQLTTRYHHALTALLPFLGPDNTGVIEYILPSFVQRQTQATFCSGMR